MVAHRLSTIQHADKIIVMHQGQIKTEVVKPKLEMEWVEIRK